MCLLIGSCIKLDIPVDTSCEPMSLQKLWEDILPKRKTRVALQDTILGGVIKEWKDHHPCWAGITRRSSKNLESCSRDYLW